MAFADFILRVLVLATAAWALLGLVFLCFRTRAFGRREFFAKPAGSAMGGVLYAFTMGMLPWAKESVRRHLLSFLLGIAYHLGILSAFFLLTMYLLGHSYPLFGDTTGLLIFNVKSGDATFRIHLLPWLLAFGAFGGISLFVKRLVNATLRGISCPDDYVSNILVTLFVILALTSTLLRQTWVVQSFFVSSLVLFVYIPLGKIRHCLFFFCTRYHFGAFFGRRGCMPPISRHTRAQRFSA